MIWPAELTQQAARILDDCRAQGVMLASAESCTGGLIAALFTSQSGSSDVVDRGFVTYSNEAKSEMLGVPSALIATEGAVSELVARAMAEGALTHSRASIAVSVTGIAGPGGGSAAKPVGLVHLACARAGAPTLHARYIFPGTRDDVRMASVRAALALIRQQLGAPVTA